MSIMQTTNSLRAKYAKRTTSAGIVRHAPGGEDVLLLCDLCDKLERIIHLQQPHLPPSQRAEFERMLSATSHTNSRACAELDIPFDDLPFCQ